MSTRQLMLRWSARRQVIKNRSAELSVQFQHDHGRPPTPVEALQLAQQATLETRDAKHEPRTLAEQRTTWHTQAAETLGGPEAVQAMINRTLHPTTAPRSPVDGAWVSRTAGLVLAALRSAARPGKAGMSAPKCNARSGRGGSHRQGR